MTKAPTSQIDSDRQQQAAFAQKVLQAEADAVARIAIDDAFHHAVDLILDHTPTSETGTYGGPGAVVVSGVGKSGLIGQKLSATMASTGTPSHFLHPTEAMHGDLGRVSKSDVVLLLSFGGNTEEVVSLATLLKQDGVATISITGKAESDLARLSTQTLCIGDVTEACPLNLAPTASTTAMLAMGDALALCVSRRRNFGVDDFRKLHPGGALGRQLMPIEQAMRWKVGDNLPVFAPTVSIKEAFAEADALPGRRPGAIMVTHDHDAEAHAKPQAGELAGILTDGDFRRLLVKHGEAMLSMPLSEVMTANPRRLTIDSLVRDAVQMIREHRIDEIPVVNANGEPVGLLDVQDLVALKVIEG